MNAAKNGEPTGQARKLYPALGRALREARLARGLSQKEVATRVRVSQGFYSHAEKGYRRPDAPQLMRLADALEADYQTLAVYAGYALKEEGDATIVVPASDAPLARWFAGLPPALKVLVRRVGEAAIVAVGEVREAVSEDQADTSERSATGEGDDGDPTDDR